MVAQAVFPRSRPPDNVVTFWPRGAARELLECRDEEVLIEGPAGTGKSYACLWKIHLLCLKYPGARWLMVRKTLTSLTSSVLVTFTKRVLASAPFGVEFFGGNKVEPAAFRYPNGSTIVVGGMDKASKIMSSEYDGAYVNEGTELREAELEAITSRLRYGVMPYQQLIVDCNPDAPSHWLNQRCNAGLMTRLRSHHEDNPAIYDHARGAYTEQGADYIGKLDRLSGVRKLRLRDGRWVQAEGAVYDFHRDIHILTELPFKPRRHVGIVDWGFTAPGTMQIAAIDGDGRAVVVDMLYMTGKTIDWWIAKGQQRQARYDVDVWVCDPAQPGYIQQFIDAGLNAKGGVNDIAPGIDKVQQRLRVDATGQPRLAFLADCQPEIDERLREDKRPLSTIDEFDLYVWAKRADGTIRDKPIDEHNHGLDPLRYLAMELDEGGAFDGETDLAAWFRSAGVAA